jgi:hypothetical protein
MRRTFPRFGPKKILAKLASDRPETAWPAASTIGDILKRQGMVTPRSARRRPLPQGNITPGADAPNDEWSIDFTLADLSANISKTAHDRGTDTAVPKPSPS